MNTLFKKTFLILFVLLVTFAATAKNLDEIKISIAQMPVVSENTEKGQFVDLVKAIARESGVKLNLQVVPFARSMKYAVSGEVDAHFPLIELPYAKESDLDFDYSTATLYVQPFVLYTNKDKDIDMNNLKNYKIETDLAHTDYFDFKVIPSTSIEASLKKVNMGRIDGFIFAEFTSDTVVKAMQLNNIKRTLYSKFNVKFVLPKGTRGKNADILLSKGVDQLRKSGELDRILGPIAAPHSDWQPYLN